MPTIGTQPSLQTTRAVGALLLHQFARERFDQAGVDDNLIREAEEMIHLDDLTTALIQEDLESRETNGTDSFSATNISAQNSDQNGTLEEQYQSITDESSPPATNSNDRTIYHSMLNASHNSTTLSSILDRTLQSSSASSSMASYGRELRKIAEEFEKSPLRQIVKQRANQVNLSDITRESFVQLLEELFQSKITREKIVILFFFCTDVALRAATFARELVVKLVGWSFTYIINTVCSLVHKLGGWDRVLFYQLPSILISCCATLVVCSLIFYLKGNLRG